MAILFCTAGCGAPRKKHRQPASAFPAKELPAQEIWNLSLVVSDSGMPKTLISARHATQYRLGEKEETRADGGVSVRIYNRNGASTFITADNAVVHDNQDIEASGHVVIRSQDGTIISTGHITRSSHDRMIRSDKFVTITSPSRTIQGYGFESDEAMKHYRIFHASGEALSQ